MRKTPDQITAAYQLGENDIEPFTEELQDMKGLIEFIDALQARVKELEAEVKQWKEMVTTNIMHVQMDLVEEENARLRKVVDAARKYVTASELPSHCVTLTQTMDYRSSLREALRELDGEKKGQESAHMSKPRVKCSCICNCLELIEAGDHRCWDCLTTNCG